MKICSFNDEKDLIVYTKSDIGYPLGHPKKTSVSGPAGVRF